MRMTLLLLPVTLAAQTAGPALRVDAAAGRHPISPYIYGINHYSSSQKLVEWLRIPFGRWGGDHTTRYNWLTDTYNSAADWFFENQPFAHDPLAEPLPNDSFFDRTVVEMLTANRGAVMSSVPILGWLPRRDYSCSYDVNKYGAQKETDQWRRNCGKGVRLDGTTIVGNDPNDTSDYYDETHIQNWVRHVVARYGTAQQGGVRFWALDNEPVWWPAVHRDIHPQEQTYDETFEKGARYAQAIKAVDPTALIFGPATAGWWDLFMSHRDLMSGWNTQPWKWWTNPVDQRAHGGLPFVPWYLQQMAQLENNGRRVLDVLEVHGYVLPDGFAFQPAGDAAKQAKRLELTRVLWDDTYYVDDPNDTFHFQPIRLIPRLREWVNFYYPGTRIAITEYNFGAVDDINGALAQADVLGIFGREDVYAGAMWGPPDTTQPAAFAFAMYLNYDGHGNGFGETGVLAASDDQGQLSVYAAERSDKALTVIVINKTTSDLTSPLELGNFSGSGVANVYRYSSADLTRITREEDLGYSGNSITATFPANSITLLVLPPAESVYTVPKPEVLAVVNAASYGRAISPGQIVAVFGTNLGGASPIYYPALLNPDMVDAKLGGVRVLFDGIPAPVIAVTTLQVNCVVPYAVATRGSVQVVVEREGRRSEPFEVQLSPAAPGIFTVNMQGWGQGAILNNDPADPAQVNGIASPAPRGRVVSVFITGEGLTDPPGVDGRVASKEPGRLEVYPKPLAAVTADIGGAPATVEYAGAAPFNVAGLCRVDVRIPENAPTGVQPIRVSVGGKPSQDGVTLVIR